MSARCAGCVCAVESPVNAFLLGVGLAMVASKNDDAISLCGVCAAKIQGLLADAGYYCEMQRYDQPTAERPS